MEVDKTKSINQMTMAELRQLHGRLRLELDTQSAIRQLKRNSGELNEYNMETPIDVNTPINQLYHYGVLGMKWGVRKDRKSGSKKHVKGDRSTEETLVKQPKAEDFVNSRVSKSKGLSRLNNEELRKLNERLNLEKQYKELTKDEQRGKKVVKRMTAKSLESGLQQTMTTVTAAVSLYAIKNIIEKKMGEDAVNKMFPKKK